MERDRKGQKKKPTSADMPRAPEEKTEFSAEENDKKRASTMLAPAAAFFKVAPKPSWEEALRQSIEAWELHAAIVQSLGGLHEDKQENKAAAALSEQARSYDYTVHKMQCDGNCFFHAVSDQLHRLGEEVSADTLRALSRTRQKTLVIVRSDGQDPTVVTPHNSNGVLILGYEVGLHYESLTRMDEMVGLTHSLQERVDHLLHPARAVSGVCY
jgi:hypothetical protein